MIKLSLGPILYYWPRQTVFSFYRDVAETPVDIVYLGEAVCSRRHELRLSDWLEIAAMLEEGGKEVVLSTQVLLESKSDLASLRRIAGNGRFTTEANDMGAIHCMAGDQAFVAGAHLNIYNAPMLDFVIECGAKRWIAPLEIHREALLQILRERKLPVETEVFSYGRMPLAFSARCFTARNRNLPKDDCRFSCIDYPDGLTVMTREHKQFLVINGIQTQSASINNLLDQIPEMQAAGIDIARISPQSQFTPEIIGLFDQVRRKTMPIGAALAELTALMPGAACDGYWHGKPGMQRVRSAEGELL